MVLSDARKMEEGSIESAEPKYCPYCKYELRVISNRSFFCGHCKVVMQIHTEYTSVDSPVLKRDYKE